MTSDDVQQYLVALQREQNYRVDAVLKESPHEVTQRVYFEGENGTQLGPYIRKFISRDAGMGAVYESIFEAQQAGRRFRHVPKIVECYWRDDSLVVVMELVSGETLQDYVYRNDPSTALARNVFPDLCDAVAELHERFTPPIIHRDLKPSNVIVSGDDLVIIDYGIAREYHEGARSDTVKFGTRAFAPPEQFGFGQTTVRSDVYALGMLLYFCLTETIPTAEAREANFADERVPEPLRAVIEQATELDPYDRYASAADLKQAFLTAHQALQPATPTEATTTGAPAPTTATPATATAPAATAAIATATATTPSMPASQAWSAGPAQQGNGQGQSPSGSSILIAICKVYNGVIIVFTALMCAASIWGIFMVPENMQQYPAWFNVLSYGFIVPAAILSFCIALLDKRRLALRFPLLQKVRGWRGWAFFAAVIALDVVLLVVSALLIALSGAPLR